VWRELARNFCYYNPLYNEFEGIPNWARQTLEEHLNDRREYLYSLKDLEEANTQGVEYKLCLLIKYFRGIIKIFNIF
jgi:hypothetical protein